MQRVNAFISYKLVRLTVKGLMDTRDEDVHSRGLRPWNKQACQHPRRKKTVEKAEIPPSFTTQHESHSTTIHTKHVHVLMHIFRPLYLVARARRRGRGGGIQQWTKDFWQKAEVSHARTRLSLCPEYRHTKGWIWVSTLQYFGPIGSKRIATVRFLILLSYHQRSCTASFVKCISHWQQCNEREA